MVPFKLGSFWGFIFPTSQDSISKERKKKEVMVETASETPELRDLVHCVLMTSWGFPRRECYLLL